jgi:PAT family beta-lactamase induction signal transducer AmpG
MKKKLDYAWRWVPSLYFIEGLPYVFVMSVSVIFYKRLGLSNAENALFTSWLYLPWVIKPLWSPLVDLIKTKRAWILFTQFFIGIAFAGIAFSLAGEETFRYSFLFFALIAFASATHDIAADGFYMIAQTPHAQAKFVGLRSAFYRVAMITGQGLFVVLAGELERSLGDVKHAWLAVYLVVFGVFLLFGIYHKFVLPRTEKERFAKPDKEFFRAFFLPFVKFFKKKNISVIIGFLLFYRFSEAQLVKLAMPFMLDPAEKGGLGLTTSDIGFIYGTVGVLFLVLGGILGGFAIARKGLKYWLFPMLFMINVPNAVYLLFALFQPQNHLIITLGVALEQFGYGFGFTAYLVYAMMISEGEFTTSHYALATGFMALGMMLPGMFSGFLQEALGYVNFFAWILIATIPSFIIAKFAEIKENYGIKIAE